MLFKNFLKAIKAKLFFFLIASSCILPIFSFNHRKKIANQKVAHSINFLHQTINKNNFPEWMISQIDKDLAPFKQGRLSKQAIDIALENYLKSDFGLGNGLELARCQIKNSNVFIHGLYPTKQTEQRLAIVIQALSNLANMIPLPDIDFIICVGDALGSQASLFFYNIPVLAFAKQSQDRIPALIPDCEALSDGFCEKVLADAAHACRYFPWEIKEEKAFWRGATTGSDISGYGLLNAHNYQEFPRVKLSQLSSQYPHLIDAKLSILAQIEEPVVYKLLAPYTSSAIPVIDHLKYKYQILIDGNTCAYSRAYWQLFSDCLTFKQTSPNIQWYYAFLQPYVHYVPIAHDLSDLVEKIEWAKNHDLEAQRIMNNAKAFAHEYLKKEDIYLYLYLFVHKYAELFKPLDVKTPYYSKTKGDKYPNVE